MKTWRGREIIEYGTFTDAGRGFSLDTVGLYQVLCGIVLTTHL